MAVKKLNYFSKTVIIVLVVSVVAFIASLFIFDPKSLFATSPRSVIGLVAVPIGLLAGITFIVMLIVKKWRKASYIPLSIGICSLIVFYLFIKSEGVHIKQNLDKSIVSACKSYCKKDNSRIKSRSLNVISIDRNPEKDMGVYTSYTCNAVGTTNSGSRDTVVFYVTVDEYNRCEVDDTYRVLSPNLTAKQLAFFEQIGYTTDGQIVHLDWDSYWEYLRQAAAYDLFSNMDIQIIQSWCDVDGQHIQMEITPQSTVHDLKIAFFAGNLDAKRNFSYVESLAVHKWPGTFRKGHAYSKEFVFKTTEQPYIIWCVLADDVFSDEWLEKYVRSKMDDDFFWDYYANLNDYNDRKNKLFVSKLINGSFDIMNYSEAEKQKSIIELYSSIYSTAISNFYIDQFSDSEYNLENIKASIEKSVNK